MLENEIKDFWQTHPCGAELVGDLTDETIDEYEHFFERYDRYRYTKEPHILDQLDRMDLKGKRVLEIGIGQGADAEQIELRGGIYSGVDLTDEAVKRVKTRFAIKACKSWERVEQASALDLPFDDSSFDLVYSFGVLHHIPEIRHAQAEIARVLRAEGRLYVMLYAKWSVNYLLSISLARRLGLLAMWLLGMKGNGIYAAHLNNAQKVGIMQYLRMSNFIHVSTDGPHNPYSKVYSHSDVERDFPDFEIVSVRKEFMHAPPLPVSWLPLARLLGWHLMAELKPRKEV